MLCTIQSYQIEDFLHELNNWYSLIYKTINDIQTNIKPLIAVNDDYALYYFLNKFHIIQYKALEKGVILKGNGRCRGRLKKSG